MAAEDDDGPKAAKPGERKTTGARRQRPPVTIDLTAAPAEPPKADAPKSEAPPPEPPRPAPPPPPEPPRMPPPAANAIAGGEEGWTRLALAGAAGGLVALALVLVLQGIGLLPAPGRTAANQAAEQAKAASATASGLERRLSAVEMLTDGVAATRDAASALGDRVARLESADTQLAPRDQVMALSAQVAALANSGGAGASRDDLARLADRIARLESAVAAGSGPAGAAVTVQNGRIDDVAAGLTALAGRVDALEGKVAAAPAAGSEAARSVALVALRRAAESGAPFASDLDMAAALGLAPADAAALRPLAEKGVASAASLAEALPADAILAASAAADPDAGFWRRLAGGVSGLVSVRPVGPVAGSDPPAIVSRMRAAAEKGDLATALKEREALPQAGKDASADWANRARDRVTVDGVIARIADAAAKAAGN
jgi:hypothetical protein